jgi:thioesterase domain-containing protein
MMTPGEFTAYLHQNIPLTAAVGATVVRNEVGELEVAAPLTPNLNHRNTAFGGSLATLGIVSAWALLRASLMREDMQPKIVIQRSECDFLDPAAAELSAVSLLPPDEWQRFMKTLRRYRRARIGIDTTIRCNGSAVVQHRGLFVAIDDGTDGA